MTLSRTLLLASGLGMLSLGACKKDKDSGPSPEQPVYKVNLYQPTTSSSDPQLQMTVFNDNKQFSTIGRFSGQTPQAPNAAFTYENATRTASLVLYDAQQTPAFLYGLNPTTGEKKHSLVELERVDATNTILRLYYYDWEARLGTLVLETKATKTTTGYTFTKQFEIADPTFGGRGGKRNTSFPVPLLRLSQVQHQPHPVTGGALAQRGTSALTPSQYLLGSQPAAALDVEALLQHLGSRAGTLTADGAGDILNLLQASTRGPAITNSAQLLGAVAVVDNWLRTGLTALRSQVQTGAAASLMPGQPAQNVALTVSGSSITVPLAAYQGYTFAAAGHLAPGFSTSFPSLYQQVEQWITFVETATETTEDLNDLATSAGVLHFSLNWNTNDTDIDLWVTDPSGEKIYYANNTSASGGYLDRDDTDGFGPENIYFRRNAPDGIYKVEADYYAPSSGPATTAQVACANGLGFRTAVNLSLARDPAGNRTKQAFRIQKNGTSCTVLN